MTVTVITVLVPWLSIIFFIISFPCSSHNCGNSLFSGLPLFLFFFPLLFFFFQRFLYIYIHFFCQFSLLLLINLFRQYAFYLCSNKYSKLNSPIGTQVLNFNKIHQWNHPQMSHILMM